MTRSFNQYAVTLLFCLSFIFSANAYAQRVSSPPNKSTVVGPARSGNPVKPGRNLQPPQKIGPQAEQRPNRQNPPVAPPLAAGNNRSDVPNKLALKDAVTMLQSRFNATAVKTESLVQSGQLLYRIRLINADKSKVWTVDVDPQTGELN